MSIAQEFVANYKEADSVKVAFTWNGKHSAEFQDANQEFRWEVARYCMEHPELAPPNLLAALFCADAEWSRQAWCSPNHFEQLAGALLTRGGESVLDTFAQGLYTSFDTYGACHHMQLPRHVIISLSEALQQRIPLCADAQRKKFLEGSLELFGKLENGVATQGWQTLPPGASVSDVQVVWPRWYHLLWRRIRSWF